MPLVYEHWRPDTEECFYVGMSVLDEPGAIARASNYRRPFNKYHCNVVRKLKNAGLKPYFVVVERYGDPESARAREKMQIAYRRSLIGNKLTNITDGGEGGPIMFGEDNPMSNPVVRRRAMLYLKGNRHHAKTPENRKKASLRMLGSKNPMNRPEVRRKVLSEKNMAQKREAIKQWWRSEEGEAYRVNLNKRNAETGAGCGEKNANAKLSVKQVSRIRELIDGNKVTLVEIAKLFDVSLAAIKRIKYRKAWK